MDFSLRKLYLIEWLESLQDEVLIAKIEQLKNKTNSGAANTIQPMSKEEMILRAEKAEQDIVSGNLFSSEELKKESENW